MRTVSDHILLPHAADWSREPDLRRLWRTGVDRSLTGKEERVSVRGAWLELGYTVLPWNHIERAKLEPRARQARKIGKVAVPHLGRGAKLSANVAAAATSIVLDRSSHGYVQYEWLFLQRADPASFDTWDVVFITAIAGATLTISPALTYSYSRGEWVRPLLFGRLTPERFQPLNRSRGYFPFTVTWQGVNLLAMPVDTFESYAAGVVGGSLTGGEAWSAAWVLGNASVPGVGTPPYDDFESYGLGAISAPLNGGVGWDNTPWVISAAVSLEPLCPYEDWESYSLGAAGTLAGGMDWTGNWVISAATSPEPPPPPYESFESYADGTVSDPLNAGDGWAGAWVFGDAV